MMIVHVSYQGFLPFFEQKTQGLFKDLFLIFQGLYSAQKRASSL